MKNKFPGCFTLLNFAQWTKFCEIHTDPLSRDQLVSCLDEMVEMGEFPLCITDLVRLENAVHIVKTTPLGDVAKLDRITINPLLEMLTVSWSGLVDLIDGKVAECFPAQECYILVWRQEGTQKTVIKQASSRDLLALKIVLDNEDPAKVAQEIDVPVGQIDVALDAAVSHGILLAPESKIQRTGVPFRDKQVSEKFLKAEVFTLQWHITQACDLHCKHCYDRSSREDMSFSRAIDILDDFRVFCRDRFVDGQVSFTGGNPFLHPHFMELYQAAVDRNLGVAVLGNPVPEKDLDDLLTIQRPAFYQVSLEGLAHHNDSIRGQGHFQRSMDFLKILKDRAIYSMVMLTLTKENQGQVLELAEVLRDRVDLFTFNRLSMVGEGANLKGAEVAGYEDFLNSYTVAAKSNPVMGLKDNMINIVRNKQGVKFFGGCAGFGCGAAFNFVSVLPDGEVHACRKYPSPIGNIFIDSLGDIYESKISRRYRQGSKACDTCQIRPVCGGCPAVVYGLGKDPFNDLDPYCFV